MWLCEPMIFLTLKMGLRRKRVDIYRFFVYLHKTGKTNSGKLANFKFHT